MQLVNVRVSKGLAYLKPDNVVIFAEPVGSQDEESELVRGWHARLGQVQRFSLCCKWTLTALNHIAVSIPVKTEVPTPTTDVTRHAGCDGE